jgi:hypothetical protein
MSDTNVTSPAHRGDDAGARKHPGEIASVSNKIPSAVQSPDEPPASASGVRKALLPRRSATAELQQQITTGATHRLALAEMLKSLGEPPPPAAEASDNSFPPSLDELIEHCGGYDKITEEDWITFDAANTAYQAHRREQLWCGQEHNLRTLRRRVPAQKSDLETHPEDSE